MREHLKVIDVDDEKIIHISTQMKGVLDQLKKEDKFLGIIFTEDEIKVVETEDFFDITKYDSINQMLTIIIDRNLFIAARELYDIRFLSTARQSFFAQLLIYAMFTNATFDPTIPTYEGGNSKIIRATNDILKFRIIDNLALDDVMDLVYNQIDCIPVKSLKLAKRIMRPINKTTWEENYNKQLTMFKRNYPFILKAILLMRSPGLNLYRRIKYYFDWMHNEYISNSAAITFVIYSFHKNGGIIKNCKTNDYNKLISSIKNATWDLTLITYFKDQAKKHANRYYLLSTMDKHLLAAAKYFLSIDETIMNDLFGNKVEEVQKIINVTNDICNLPGRKEIVIDRLNNVDALIISLENEIKKTML